jgi:hypothetical protein
MITPKETEYKEYLNPLLEHNNSRMESINLHYYRKGVNVMQKFT